MSKKVKDKIEIELNAEQKAVIDVIDKEHSILDMKVHTVLSDSNGKLYIAFELAEIVKKLSGEK